MAQTTKALTTLEIGAEGGFQIPVSLKRIAKYDDIALDSASPQGNPMKQVDVDIVTGEMVERAAKRRGIFRSKPKKSDKLTWGEFVEISQEDLSVIEEATNIPAFTIDHFIPLRDVPFERATDAYYLAPAEGMSAKPLVLLAKALRKSKRAGVFKMVKASRQYLAVVYEKGGGLIVNTLAFSGDFAAAREAAEALDRQDGKVSAAEVEMGLKLVEALSAEADVLDGFEDDLVPLRADLVERALRGERLPRSTRVAQSPSDGDDLEAKLRASIAQLSSSGRKKATVPA